MKKFVIVIEINLNYILKIFRPEEVMNAIQRSCWRLGLQISTRRFAQLCKMPSTQGEYRVKFSKDAGMSRLG